MLTAPVTVCTMTIMAEMSVTESTATILNDFLNHLPLNIAEDEDVDRDRFTKRSSQVEISTNASWNGREIVSRIRASPYMGIKGCGVSKYGNFRNCIPFCVDRQGIKVFRSGKIQGWGFRKMDDFQQFTGVVLREIFHGNHLIPDKTRVALLITNSTLNMKGLPALPLRAIARHVTNTYQSNVLVKYNPEDNNGVSIKLLNVDGSKRATVIIRGRGNVKVFCGTPGEEFLSVNDGVWKWLEQCLGGVCSKNWVI